LMRWHLQFYRLILFSLWPRQMAPIPEPRQVMVTVLVQRRLTPMAEAWVELLAAGIAAPAAEARVTAADQVVRIQAA